MSLTRKALSAMGIDAEKIDQIIELHTETVTALKSENDDLQSKLNDAKAEQDKLKETQKELSALQKKVEADAKEREGKDYDKLLEEFNSYKADQEAKATKAAKEKAFRELLSDMKVSDKGVKAILKWQGVDSVEIDEEGKLKNATELRKSVKEDWGDYITTSETKGASTSNPPANNVGGTGKTKAEIMKIKDAGERQKAIRENPQLFGLPAEA